MGEAKCLVSSYPLLSEQLLVSAVARGNPADCTIQNNQARVSWNDWGGRVDAYGALVVFVPFNQETQEPGVYGFGRVSAHLEWSNSFVAPGEEGGSVLVSLSRSYVEQGFCRDISAQGAEFVDTRSPPGAIVFPPFAAYDSIYRVQVGVPFSFNAVVDASGVASSGGYCHFELSRNFFGSLDDPTPLVPLHSDPARSRQEK
jgi:hypothetical protein